MCELIGKVPKDPLDPIKESLGLKSEMVSLVRYNLSSKARSVVYYRLT